MSSILFRFVLSLYFFGRLLLLFFFFLFLIFLIFIDSLFFWFLFLFLLFCLFDFRTFLLILKIVIVEFLILSIWFDHLFIDWFYFFFFLRICNFLFLILLYFSGWLYLQFVFNIFNTCQQFLCIHWIRLIYIGASVIWYWYSRYLFSFSWWYIMRLTKYWLLGIYHCRLFFFWFFFFRFSFFNLLFFRMNFWLLLFLDNLWGRFELLFFFKNNWVIFTFRSVYFFNIRSINFVPFLWYLWSSHFSLHLVYLIIFESRISSSRFKLIFQLFNLIF